MSKFTQSLRRIIMLSPIVMIAGASFLPMQTWCQQALVLCTLIWFNVFILFEVLGK